MGEVQGLPAAERPCGEKCGCAGKYKGRRSAVLNCINRLGICNLRFKTTDETPFFLNIPVFGEAVFNCDRRIWKTILFEKVLYQW